MGKGTIEKDNDDGSYSVKIIYGGRLLFNEQITDLNTRINALQSQIDGMEEGLEKEIARLHLAALQKRIDYLTEHMPDDITIERVWCADLTTGLTGDVGTIEVPGERTDGLQIQPGYGSNAVYNETRDAQLMPAVSLSAPAAYYMRAVLPGWQKWYPTFRYGTIIADSIDFDNDTCDVCLDPAYSTQRNLAVNQNQGFSECDVSPPSGFTQFCTDNPTHPT
jgi:hypothetical protein